jgi:hypothetical protein
MYVGGSATAGVAQPAPEPTPISRHLAMPADHAEWRRTAEPGTEMP